MGRNRSRLESPTWAGVSPPLPPLTWLRPLLAASFLAPRCAALSPRDPVRVEWAPEAAVEYSGSTQKQAGAIKPAVELTADASGPGRAAASASQAILEKRRKHVGPNLVRRNSGRNRFYGDGEGRAVGHDGAT